MLRIEIPIEREAVVSENHREHHQVKARKMKGLRQRGFLHARAASRREALPAQKACVFVEVKRPKNSRGDAANLTPTVKALFDGMVADAHLLPDDSDKYVRGPFIIPADTADIPGRFTFIFHIIFAEALPLAASLLETVKGALRSA